jgi:inhibitor of cysteine peptidase
MKPKLAMICSITLLLVAGLFACAAPAAGNIQLSCDDFSTNNNITKSINVAAGSTFTVTLCSNATTGYQWSEDAKISDKAVVEQVKQEFVSPTSGLEGAPGKQVWTFKALKAGTANISMDYSRNWEGGEKGTWAFNLNVTVK